MNGFSKGSVDYAVSCAASYRIALIARAYSIDTTWFLRKMKFSAMLLKISGVSCAS